MVGNAGFAARALTVIQQFTLGLSPSPCLANMCLMIHAATTLMCSATVCLAVQHIKLERGKSLECACRGMFS